MDTTPLTSLRLQAQAWLEISRVSNLPTIWSNVLAAWLLSGGGWADPRLGWMLLAASLIYTAGMILNDAADAAVDQSQRPQRPIPSGRIQLRWAWRVGLTMLACAVGMMVGRAQADPRFAVGLAVAILAYDLYHKPWPGSVLIMGACRTLLMLTTASCLLPSHTGIHLSVVFIPSLILGIYVVALSLVARSESSARPPAALVKLLYSALLYLPGIWGLWLAFQLQTTLPLLLSAAYLIWIQITLRRLRSNPPASIGHGVGILLATILWVDAIFISHQQAAVALTFLLSVPLARFWQKWVAAT
jgi:heme O synthase-like polyprenyltransferase